MPVRKRTKKKTPKRRTTRRAAPKKRKTTRKSTPRVVTQEQRQLAVFHDPFSRATKQPKIPDGKCTESVGFQTQAVKEVATSPAHGGRMHILLYPGQDAGVVVTNSAEADAAYSIWKHDVVGFTDSNNIDWSSLLTSTGGTMEFDQRYALWRVVSQGLRLSLLNPAEEDDGWWEAVRVSVPIRTSDYMLCCKDADPSTANRAAKGTVAPLGVISALTNDNLVNERSYTTGLLRDLKNHVFSLHSRRDDHDFKTQTSKHYLLGTVCQTEDATDHVMTFLDGADGPKNLVEKWIDQSQDMIYIRIHGRPDTGQSSRLHLNVVSNQEIQFHNNESESRFHTGSTDIGGHIDQHIAAKRLNGSASHMIM